MKNIVLSDRGTLFTDQIIKLTDWNIALLIIDDFGHHYEKYINNPRIHKILKLSEIIYDKSYIDFDLREMQNYMSLFHIGDYGSRRINDDLFFSHYQFYSAYGYWKTYLKDHTDIDICIITNTIHGFASDYLLEEMMKQAEIPCYNIFYHFFDKYGIYKINEDKLLKNSIEKSIINIEDITFYASRYNYNSGIESIPHSSVLRLIYKLFGAYGVRIASFIVRGKYPIHYHDSDLYSYCRARKHIRKMKRYVKKLYDKCDMEVPFFIYFLHFEPEAVITGNAAVVDSQLLYIRLLSQSLPKGCYLYVKEHPDLYKINMWEMEYHIPSMETFYTKYFYDQLKAFTNVRLLDYKISATEIIKKSRAVVTIAGTVLSEAIIEEKPIIMFAGKKHIYTYDENVFCPYNTNELRDCVSRIMAGFKPDYSNIPYLIESYLFDKSIQGEDNVIKQIMEDIERCDDI